MADIDVVLLPCRGKKWLLFPRAIVGRVYPFAPMLTVENASEFVIGSIIVQNEKMPVLDFNFSASKDEYDGVFRILLISTITEQAICRRYAVLSYGEPEIINISDELIKTVSKGEHRYVAQHVAIDDHEDKEIYLLDLPFFEVDLRVK